MQATNGSMMERIIAHYILLKEETLIFVIIVTVLLPRTPVCATEQAAWSFK